MEIRFMTAADYARVYALWQATPGMGLNPDDDTPEAIARYLRLRPCGIVLDGGRCRPEIAKQKTGKRRVFTVPPVIRQYIENYCLRLPGL